MDKHYNYMNKDLELAKAYSLIETLKLEKIKKEIENCKLKYELKTYKEKPNTLRQKIKSYNNHIDISLLHLQILQEKITEMKQTYEPV